MSRKTKTIAMKEDGKSTLTPKLRFPEFRGGPGWRHSKLGKEASLLKGKGISKSDISPNGPQACIRYGELYTHYGEIIDAVISRTAIPASELFLSKVNDVIIPSSGETKIDIAKASCVLADNIALGGDLTVIRSPLNGPFLSYYLNGPKKYDIAKVAQGDTVVHLYPWQLEELEVAFPSPAEQQKIAECLSSLDELIGTESQKLDALKAHKKGLMQQLFPREGETLPRLRFPEFLNAQEWEYRPLGELGDIITGKTPSTKDAELWGGDIFFITPTDIKDGEKYQHTTARTVVETENTRVLPAGSVVYTCIASIGKMAITVRASITNQQINAVVANEGVEGEFIYYALANLTPWIQSIPSSSTLPIINKTEFSKICIAVAHDIAEQQVVVACLFSLDDLIAAQSAKLEALKFHKKGLMQQLFPLPEAEA